MTRAPPVKIAAIDTRHSYFGHDTFRIAAGG